MPHPEQHFGWTWELNSPPATLWPLVSNTDRFNRDCGYPAVTRVTSSADSPASAPNSRRLRTSVLGIAIEWDERAFEWISPRRFGVERNYLSGPVARMIVTCELARRPDGGTTVDYRIRITPANLLGRLALPLSIGRNAGTVMERVMRRYDDFARQGLRASQLAHRPRFAPAGSGRLRALSRTLAESAGQPPALVERLEAFLATADDLALARIRPYVVADEWRADRRATLGLFLHATRVGLVDLSWDLVCPHCRGANAGANTLRALRADAHCPSCGIDFTANFDQSLELTFRPNAAIRAVERLDYCVGGPQVTPHVVAQQHIPAAGQCVLPVELDEGRYRVRTPDIARHLGLRVTATGAEAVTLSLGDPEAPEAVIAPSATLTLINSANQPRLAIVEHLAWTDQAATAAEVTALQAFRDLFSTEVLRPGEQFSVGSLTLVFTDLKNSTQLYQDIGDAPAFGRVLTHFDVLRAAVAAEGGAIVKTMGDAIMAVFTRPVAAVRALSQAQRWLRSPSAIPATLAAPGAPLQPLALKVGIHAGPCLAINQNEQLDYFGTTVNITARLCGLSSGNDVVLSAAVHGDPEVAAHLGASSAECRAEAATLRGFREAIEIVRFTPASKVR